MKLWIVGFVIILLNLPFGYWRANTARFSRQWFLAIHLPVPLVITCRILGGLGWQLATFPVLVGAFLSGQFLGGKIFQLLKIRSENPPTSCIFLDLVRQIQRKA